MFYLNARQEREVKRIARGAVGGARADMIRFLILSPLLVAPAVSQAASITGRASVIDGDTIEIHGQRIRLYGIDAPESRQSCMVLGKSWRCGQQAAGALAETVPPAGSFRRALFCVRRTAFALGPNYDKWP